MIRSLIDIYRHEGWLPDCRMLLCKGYTQGRFNADVLIAEAYLKNTSDINWTDAYAAVMQDAEVEPQNWLVQGRGGLNSWKNLEYIPVDDFDPYGQGLLTRSVSRTVEYAYNDFCISELARAFCNVDDYNEYVQRSGNWKSLYQSNQTSLGFTGFLQPKYLNATWCYQEPRLCTPLYEFESCYLNPCGHETYEGSPWLYTFYAAPHDMGALIGILGGSDAFTKRLNYLHDSGLLYIGDENAFLPVWLFHYAGRPGLSSERVHDYIPSQFNSTLVGIPGNDDSGAMGAFSFLSMLGTYPVHGQNVYLLAPPFFREVNITHGITGNTATIRVTNFETNYSSQ